MTTSIAPTPNSAAGRRRLWRRLRRAAGGLFLVRDARAVLAAAVAIDDALAGGVEGLPGDAGGIVDPRLLGFGIAAGRLALFDDLTAGLPQPRIDVLQLVGGLDLDAEVIEARLPSSRRDREIDARVLQHPLRIVGFHHGRLRCKERRVEADRMGDILDGDVNMEALHGVSF